MRTTAVRLALGIVVITLPLLIARFLFANGLNDAALTFFGIFIGVGGIAMLLLRGSVPVTRMLLPAAGDVFASFALLNVIPVSHSTGLLVMSIANIIFLVNEQRRRRLDSSAGTA